MKKFKSKDSLWLQWRLETWITLILQFQHIGWIAKANTHRTIFLMRLNSEIVDILYRMQSPHLAQPQSARSPDHPPTSLKIICHFESWTICKCDMSIANIQIIQQLCCVKLKILCRKIRMRCRCYKVWPLNFPFQQLPAQSDSVIWLPEYCRSQSCL